MGEAEHLRIRSDLMMELQKRIAEAGHKQADVAKILKVTQPRVSDLLKGRLDLFSTDTLIDMLACFGVKVHLVLKSSRYSRRVG
jgi:predicted XRE-type DNA-binding protein